ncbi:MAG TPA: hypothetical protein VEP90_24070 [Methylomirabilota bacterium]|nr:hypothetical protein [Methylomirabilota bacterium]
MQISFDRPVALRRTTGSLSGGTRVDVVQDNNDGTVDVLWKDERITTDRDNLVLLRNRKKMLPGAELRMKMSRLLGGSQ